MDGLRNPHGVQTHDLPEVEAQVRQHVETDLWVLHGETPASRSLCDLVEEGEGYMVEGDEDGGEADPVVVLVLTQYTLVGLAQGQRVALS